ncbi:MAG: LD-carboxypeptidase [Dehalococcoidia bacterium]
MNTLTMHRPKALRPGDTIAVVAPSSPASPKRLAYGVDLLRSWGFDVRVMPSCETGRGYLAGESAEQVAAELSTCFADPTIDGILCARGGYGTMHLLPFVDWDAVRANPKVFCGYSDITGLHLAIRREASFVTFHGSMVQRQGDEPELHPWSAAGLRHTITSTAALGVVSTPGDGPAVTTLVPGIATGPFVGGNLTLICSLIGSRWQLDARDCVLLLEDTDEAPYRVDRMLTQLRLSGALDGVRGIVFGDSPACEAPPEDTRSFPLTTVIGERLGGLGVPLIYGFPCGHSPWRATLPLGVPVTLDADAGTLTFPEPACMP